MGRCAKVGRGGWGGWGAQRAEGGVVGVLPSRETPGGSWKLWHPMAEPIRGVSEDWNAVSVMVKRGVKQKVRSSYILSCL